LSKSNVAVIVAALLDDMQVQRSAPAG
jgi:hypothetical protein